MSFFFCCFNRMFSGLRLQWIILFLCKVFKYCRIEWVNLRIKGRLKFWNLFFLMSSQRFMFSSLNVMQMWLRKVKFFSMWMTFMVLFLFCLRRCFRIRIFFVVCRWKRFSFRIIFRVTCWWILWSQVLIICLKLFFLMILRISYL